MILESAILCLALNIYHEARGEFIPGQYAVAHVTLNRADRDPEKVCRVVVEKDQFSWTRGLVRRDGRKFYVTKAGQPKEEYAWEVAKKVAVHAILNSNTDLSRGATYYHANYVKPKWSFGMQRTRVMGKHIFYKPKDKSPMTKDNV